MGRFYEGMLIHTSYCSETYVVEKVTENCTCPNYVDFINLQDKAPKSKEHCHLTCHTLAKRTDQRWLNGYDEDGVNVWHRDDRIIVEAEETLLLTMICGI